MLSIHWWSWRELFRAWQPPGLGIIIGKVSDKIPELGIKILSFHFYVLWNSKAAANDTRSIFKCVYCSSFLSMLALIIFWMVYALIQKAWWNNLILLPRQNSSWLYLHMKRSDHIVWVRNIAVHAGNHCVIGHTKEIGVSTRQSGMA